MNSSTGMIIILIVSAIIKLINHLNEKKQAENQRQSMPKIPAEELPEATRRMLYGDSQVPTARERQTPTQPTIIVARPRQVIEENEEGPHPAAPPRPAFPPPPPLTPTPRPTRLPIPPRPMQPSRPVVMQPRNVPPMQPRTLRTMPPPNVAREILTGVGRLPDSAPSSAGAEEDGGWMLRDRQERLRQAERVQGRATARANTARKNRLFAAGTDLRRAIVMNEILGPPVAMRDPFGPFQSGPSL